MNNREQLDEKKQYPHRFLSRFVIELATPLSIGSGDNGILTDSEVAIDVNGLPYLPGSTIAGVLRSMFGERADEVFGYQEGNEGMGSRIIFTEGKLVNADGTVMDGLCSESELNTEFLRQYANLPIRQHVKIGSQGTACKMGKFDEQVVFAGSRFCFETEMVASKGDKLANNDFIKLLGRVCDGDFRIGGGTRKGFGQIKVISLRWASIDLSKQDELALFLSKPSNLRESAIWTGWNPYEKTQNECNDCEKYRLLLKPVDFFMFGSGLGDEKGDSDMTTVREQYITWERNGDSEHATFVHKGVLIPAASIKGALRHRVAYYYNKEKGWTIENGKGQDAENNEGVIALFGGNTKDKDNTTVLTRGNVIIEDFIEASTNVKSKLINHVSIDRFTGGSIGGMLFTEQVDYAKETTFEINITIYPDKINNELAEDCLMRALDDICQGYLPLGGGINRGHGIFTGEKQKVTDNKKENCYGNN